MPRSINIVIGLLWSAIGCLAQVDRANLTGTVTDANGGSIGGVGIEILYRETGLRRTASTDQFGRFTVAGLPIGSLTVTFSKDGFQSVVYNNVELTVGQNRTLNLTLPLALVATQMEVRDTMPPLSQSNANVSGIIRSEELKSTPLNGRQWQGLLALSPGAINTGTGDASGVRFAGRGADDNLIRMDGVDIGGVRNLNPRGNPRLTVSLESISEFRVNAALYTAESGGSMGAQVDLVSKTGSNDFRGSLFHYFRNDQLDARAPFDGRELPPFRLNQFGGSLGGPIRKDQTFFFVTYEGLRQRRGQTLIGFVPSDPFRQRVLATSPALSPILDVYPRGTEPTNDPNGGCPRFS